VSECNRPGRSEGFGPFDGFDFSTTGSSGADSAGDQIEPGVSSQFPPDFSSDELCLAQELERYFDIEREMLPPLFTETLAAPMRYPPVAEGFEQRVTSRVFRNLQLPRRLFPSQQRFVVLSPRWALRRSALALSALLCMLMFLSAIAAGPSFARGLQVLRLHRTGVYLVEQYPQHVERAPTQTHIYVDLATAVAKVPYTLYWPTTMPQNYDKEPLIELREARSYANGPLVELEFMGSQGGEVDIREFRPENGYEVLQPADDGSTQTLTVKDGTAIYVRGGWDRQQRWVVGERSELVYEYDGLAFWVVSEGLHPLGSQDLVAIINSLQPVNQSIVAQYEYGTGLRQLGMELAGALREPSASDIVAVLPAQATEGPAKFIASGDGMLVH